jgi:hypothetical protein
VRELCAVAGRCCQRLAAAVAVTVAVSGWSWSPSSRSPRRCDSALSWPAPSPEPDSCRTIRQTGSVKGRRSRSRVTPKAPLTGSGCREHSYGGFGGGHPHFHPHAPDLLIRRFLCGHPDPFRTVHDLGLVSSGCPGGSGAPKGCSSPWLPAWLPGDDSVTPWSSSPSPDLFPATWPRPVLSQAPPPNPIAAEPDGRRVLSRGGVADHEAARRDREATLDRFSEVRTFPQRVWGRPLRLPAI